MRYDEMNKEQLLAEKQAVSALYEDYKKKGLNLTMARGIPRARAARFVDKYASALP